MRCHVNPFLPFHLPTKMGSGETAFLPRLSSPAAPGRQMHAPVITSQTPVPLQSAGQDRGGKTAGRAISSAERAARLTTNVPPAERPITSGCIMRDTMAGGRAKVPEVAATASNCKIWVPAPAQQCLIGLRISGGKRRILHGRALLHQHVGVSRFRTHATARCEHNPVLEGLALERRAPPPPPVPAADGTAGAGR